MSGSYRKHNDGSHNSSTYHKKDGTPVRAILKRETQKEIEESNTMKVFNVYTGDGNFGISFDHEIEAEDMDGAVKAYMAGVTSENRDLFEEDDAGEDCATLTVYELEDGSRAHNGGAYFCAEIRLAATDPR